MPTKSSSSSARPPSRPETALAFSNPRWNSRSGATTFSSTVIPRNSRVIWKVRPRPRCARRQGGFPSIRCPSNQTSPACGAIVPPIRLKTVVLPDPFGPISAVIEPSGTLTGREIPIVGDEYVDPEFGTGAVKVTPAHDPNDYQIGLRHDLEQLLVMNDDATMNAAAGADFEGLDRFKAREKVVERFEELGLLERVEDYEITLPVCERCKTV